MHPLPPLPPPAPSLADRAWLPFDNGNGSDSDEELQNWSSLIGIVTAICGNILIALALNVQRHAHIRLHRKRIQVRERARQAMKNAAANARDQGQSAAGGGIYGAAAGSPTWDGNGEVAGERRASGLGRYSNERYSNEDARDSSETEPLAQSFRSDGSGDDEEEKVASTYLKDPYWWLGQVLNTVGEMGNFLAYGFAPASIVSPLGVVALVSNCVIAPLFFKEVFRQRDFWGVIIAITGAVTVVLSAKTEETKLGPHEVWDAITTMAFEIYMGVSCSLIVLLMWLSPRYGNRTILIDLGLVGLFGGYTALATKGVSSMLSSTLFGAFTTPLTYVLLFVLLSTAIMQIRYVNKALQRFESTQVIPTQFVLFTLSVIIGSAVLYRDFERTTSEQAIKFVGGCLFTFFGVFLITSGRPRQEDEEEATLSDTEGIEETIGLAEQDSAGAPPPSSSRRAATPKSRGSWRGSHVSFKAANSNKPLPRVPPGPSSTTTTQKPLPIPIDEDTDEEDAPLLGGTNSWTDNTGEHRPIASSMPPLSSKPDGTTGAETPKPRPKSRPTTTITIPTSTPVGSTPPRLTLSSATDRPRFSLSSTADRPHTPRASASTSRLHHVVYSPSPFSSTLSAVVGDKLLAMARGSLDGGEGLGSSGGDGRRGGTGWRASLFNNPLPPPGGNDAGAGISQEDRGIGVERGGDAAGGNGNNAGLRGRARSLSHTLGGLAGWFGGSTVGGDGILRGKKSDGGSSAEVEEGRAVIGEPLARAKTATGAGSAFASPGSSSSGSGSSGTRGARTDTL